MENEEVEYISSSYLVMDEQQHNTALKTGKKKRTSKMDFICFKKVSSYCSDKWVRIKVAKYHRTIES